MVRTLFISLTATVAFVSAPESVPAQGFDWGAGVTLPSGETRQGDLYAAGESVRIDGRLAGDLVAAAQRIFVDGQIDGDLFAIAREVVLRGPVGDSTRVVADGLTVDSTIDGDLIVTASRLHLSDGARISGDLVTAASAVEVEGTVEGITRVAAGEIVISGTLRGDANLVADRVDLAPGARIEGDLDYRARTPLSPEATARVAGTVRYDDAVEEDAADEDGSAGILTWRLLFRVWQVGAALLTGLLAVALFRRGVQHLVTAIAGETTVGTLLGFAAFLIVPAAAGVALVTLVGIPVGVVAILLFGVALYAAKLPIAVWAGGRLLALAGRPQASPYAAMAIGIPVLYALFAIPYLGWLIWLIATWLGLGAMVLSGRGYLGLAAQGR